MGVAVKSRIHPLAQYVSGRAPARGQTASLTNLQPHPITTGVSTMTRTSPTWNPQTADTKLERIRALDGLWKALEFMDKCRSQNNSGETGAYRDAVEWIESSAREVSAAFSTYRI